MIDKKQLASQLGISVTTVNRLLSKGMPRVKIGRSVRFDFEEVVQWLKSRN